jgi:putative transposase
MSRGNRRGKIFLDDVDRQDFLKTLAEACQKTGWQVHAYCLMPNHYHLVVETPEPNLVVPRCFQWNQRWGRRSLPATK